MEDEFYDELYEKRTDLVRRFLGHAVMSPDDIYDKGSVLWPPARIMPGGAENERSQNPVQCAVVAGIADMVPSIVDDNDIHVAAEQLINARARLLALDKMQRHYVLIRDSEFDDGYFALRTAPELLESAILNWAELYGEERFYDDHTGEPYEDSYDCREHGRIMEIYEEYCAATGNLHVPFLSFSRFSDASKLAKEFAIEYKTAVRVIHVAGAWTVTVPSSVARGVSRYSEAAQCIPDDYGDIIDCPIEDPASDEELERWLSAADGGWYYPD